MSPRTSALAILAPLAVLSLCLPACQKTVGDALRPDEHTGAAAVGAELVCSDAPTRIKPLVVDWDPDARVDLEAAMQGSVVVVKYDCPSVEILPGCSVDGSYSYAGVSRKEQVIQMTNMDEVQANIPISSAEVGVDIQSGRAIDLATVLVGRRSTTVTSLKASALEGECAGATHFVRSASLGAFSMATGSKGKAAVAAELFGYGGGASSDSSRSALNADGDFESCQSSDPGSGTPPSECQAPVRIELVPIKDGGAGADAGESDGKVKVAGADNPCMPGFVSVDGLCTRPTEDRAYLCDPNDEAECKAQCDKGNVESCYNYGRLRMQKSWEIGDEAEPLTRACDAGIAPACTLLGDRLWGWYDPEEDPEADQKLNEAFRLLNIGCEGGEAYACELVGDIFGTEDLPSFSDAEAFKFHYRSCELGSGVGCSLAAERLFEGKGVATDLVKGVETLMRSCEGGSVDECGELATYLSEGKYGLPQDFETASVLMMHACIEDVGWCESACEIAGQAGNAQYTAAACKRDCDYDDESASCSKL